MALYVLYCVDVTGDSMYEMERRWYTAARHVFEPEQHSARVRTRSGKNTVMIPAVAVGRYLPVGLECGAALIGTVLSVSGLVEQAVLGFVYTEENRGCGPQERGERWLLAQSRLF